MTPAFKNGKPLFHNGKPQFKCDCCSGACPYQVNATLNYGGAGSGDAQLYGNIDGGTVLFGGAANFLYPTTPPHQMNYASSVAGSQAIFSPAQFNAASIDSAHTYRFWWSDNDAATPALNVTAIVTIGVGPGVTICVNGVTLTTASHPGGQLVLTLDKAPGDGDQSGYGGGLVVDITCGACP